MMMDSWPGGKSHRAWLVEKRSLQRSRQQHLANINTDAAPEGGVQPYGMRIHLLMGSQNQTRRRIQSLRSPGR